MCCGATPLKHRARLLMYHCSACSPTQVQHMLPMLKWKRDPREEDGWLWRGMWGSGTVVADSLQ